MQLTAAMRDLLIEHIDGPIQVRIRGRSAIWRAAFQRELICGTVNGETRPRYSRLTDFGRATLAKELAHWADTLVRAGYDVKVTPKWSRPERLAA